MSFAKGSKLPVHHVNCLDCGCALERRSYYRFPRCKPCGVKRYKQRDGQKTKILRQQARRYRILRDALGWTDVEFEWRLAALRERLLPRTRAQRYDLGMERRASGN